MNNPYQHSDLAVAIYQWLSEKAILQGQEDEGLVACGLADMGLVACGLADMLAKDFDVELQPVKE